jgi:multidrug efflux system membrane fusion protein
MAAKGLRWGLVGVGVVAVGLFSWSLLHKKPPAKGPPPAVTAIATGKVEVRDVPVSINALGQAQGWQAVLVRAQANGRLLQVPVKEGSDVEKGALIAEIDPAPYKAALMQAEGALRRDQAQLDLARLDLTRYQQLAKQDSIAGQQVDAQAAQVKQMEGTVLIDQGSVAAAQVNMNYTRILAPVAGRIGVRLVDAGNLVSTTDTTGIVTINQVSPIAVTFTLPQGEFLRLAEVSDGFRKLLKTEAFSQETDELLGLGELTVVDNRVDPATATVTLKARFPNEKRLLWPGQLINVKLTLHTMNQATALPTAAVNQGPNGPFTYVVGPDNKAVLRPLVVDLRQDEVTVVKSGVKPGETVVTEGQMSLRPGAKVAVRRPPPAARGPNSRRPAA